MAMAAVTFLVEQVNEVMTGYKDLISGAETEFTQLKNELNLLKAVLMDVAKKKKTEQHIYRELERQIKEVVYDVEETIDICLSKADAKTKGTFRRVKLLSSKRFYLANEVKSIREEKLLPLIKRAKDDFAMVAHVDDESPGMGDPRTIFRLDQPMRRNRIVGFQDEESTITGYLMERTKELDIIAITGLPGQGKTTLASMIYEKEEICNHFPVRMWINISQKFNIRDVYLQILKIFMPNQSMSKNIPMEALSQTVRECLEKERFLLVLDDVCSVDAWNEIKEVLPLKSELSKVLITSRDKGVGARSSRERGPHELRFLTREESWTLLQYVVFGNEEECPLELGSIGEEIALRCDGVPLAVVMVGGILTRSSPSAKEWKMFLEHMTDSDEAAQRLTDAVELSYRRLPDDLKECFVYLGVFPEDYEIPRKMLSGLWISEGFVLPRDQKSLEESAGEKLNDLVSRNLLMVDKTNHMGEPKSFVVHKIIRAFCIAKSMDSNLFQEMKESETGAVLKPSPSEVQHLRRLCFHSNIIKFLSTTQNGPRLRSFLCFHKQPVEMEQQYLTVIPDCFPRLRILESKSIRFQQFPAMLTKLIHLRYLTLYIHSLKVLPQEITQLWNLLSLVVETESREATITMKANIWRMVRLRHLKTQAAIVLDDKKWEGEAGNLHTLSRLSAESFTEVVSQRATNLKTLGMYGELANIFKTKLLENLRRLEKLKLESSSTSEDTLRDFPQSNVFPPNLRRLTLTNTRLRWEDMSTLAMIKSLEVLKLRHNAFVGVSWKAVGYNFPSLQLLLIVNAGLVLWDASTDTFPSLRFLVVNNCENLIEIPECVGEHLQRLDIDHVRRSAVESAKRIGETQSKSSLPFDLNLGPPCETK